MVSYLYSMADSTAGYDWEDEDKTTLLNACITANQYGKLSFGSSIQ